MKMKKSVLVGVTAFGFAFSTVVVPSISHAAGYPGHYVDRGDRGNDVTAVQKQLLKWGYHLAVDGIFGTRTLDDVKDFQKMKGLSVDGIVGPKTWNSLWNTSTHSGSSNTSQTLKMGSRGQQVKDLQRKLNKLGYTTGPIDGIYGSKTKNAVETFQVGHNLQKDGIYGPKTMKVLNGIWISTKYPGHLIKEGDQGSIVKQVQDQLPYRYVSGIHDGRYGPKTVAYVKKYQKAHHLKA